MATLLSYKTQYHRPSSAAIAKKLQLALAAAPNPPTAKDFRFPMNQRSIIKVVAALNAVDTSGQTPFKNKELHDPWDRRVIAKLMKVAR